MASARAAALQDWLSAIGYWRLACVAWVAAGLLMAWLAPGAFLLLLPLWIGALVPAVRSDRVTGLIDSIGDNLGEQPRTTGWNDVRGLVSRVVHGVSRASARINDPHLRAGARTAALLYLAGLLLGALLMAAYALIAIVVVIAFLAIMALVLKAYLSDGTTSASETDWLPAARPRRRRRVAVSRETTDFIGNPLTEHYDDQGHKVGESRPTTGFLGEPLVEHYDEAGTKTGESRPTTTLFGDPVTEHFDQSGTQVGETREAVGVFGDRYHEHFDLEGAKTGESRRNVGIMGDRRIEHSKD